MEIVPDHGFPIQEEPAPAGSWNWRVRNCICPASLENYLASLGHWPRRPIQKDSVRKTFGFPYMVVHIPILDFPNMVVHMSRLLNCYFMEIE